MQRLIEVVIVLGCALLVGYILPGTGLGQLVTLHSSQHDLQDPISITSDGPHVYFGGLNEEGISTIVKMPASGGTMTKIASGYPFVKISGLSVADDVLYVTDTGNPFDGPATLYRIDLNALPNHSIPFANLTINAARVRTEKSRIRVDGRFTVNARTDGINTSTDDVTIWFGDFSQTVFSGLPTRNDEEESFTFEADSLGVTELVIYDDGTFRMLALDTHLETLAFELPIRFALHIGNDAGETTVLLNKEGRFGFVE